MTAIRSQALLTIVLGTVSSVGRASHGQGESAAWWKEMLCTSKHLHCCFPAYLPKPRKFDHNGYCHVLRVKKTFEMNTMGKRV